jgi:hypothetical protein
VLASETPSRGPLGGLFNPTGAISAATTSSCSDGKRTCPTRLELAGASGGHTGRRCPTIFVKRMSETNYGQHGNEGPAHRDVHPYWKRAHHDWRFWVGLVLMLAAIAIYVLSDDLALLPRR